MTKDHARDLTIEHLPIDELRLDPRNPRHHIQSAARKIVGFETDSLDDWVSFLPRVHRHRLDSCILYAGNVPQQQSARLCALQ